MNRFTPTRLVTCLLLGLLICAPAWASYTTKQLAPGVTLTQDINTDPVSALIVNCASIDPKASGVQIRAAIGQDKVFTADWRKGRETISSLTARRGALLGVNADFFPFTGDPVGLCISDGQLISEPSLNRPSIAVTSDGVVFCDTARFSAKLTLPSGISRQIDGINRPRETNQLIAYTDTYGAETLNKYKATDVVCTADGLPVRAGRPVTLTVTAVIPDALSTQIPAGGMVFSAGGPAAYFLSSNIKPGDKLTAQFDITGSADWTRVEQAVSGGPWLVKDSRPYIDDDQEGFSRSFSSTHHPRTAAGITADGKMLLVTIDGRQWISGGISLPDLRALMVKLGAVNAINLDGGGSSTMSVRGLLVNSVSDTDERPVADALLIFAPDEDLPELPKLAICGTNGQVACGQAMQLSVVSGDDAKPLAPDQLAKVVWGTTDAIGFVNQMGYFTPTKMKKGSVGALYGKQKISVSLDILGGPPAKVEVQLAPDKLDPNRSQLVVTVTDAYSNRLVGKEILLNIAGGKPDTDTAVTDDKGAFTTGITWDPAAVDRTAVALVGEISGQARLEAK